MPFDKTRPREDTYAYDGLNRRTTVAQPDPDGAGSLASPVTTFGYDAVGNVTSITDPAGGLFLRAAAALRDSGNCAPARHHPRAASGI